MSATSANNETSKQNVQTQNQRCDHPQIGTSIPHLVRKLVGDKFEDELFWALAKSIQYKRNIKFGVAGAFAVFLAVGGSIYAVHNINSKLDRLILAQGQGGTSNPVVMQASVDTLPHHTASDEVKKQANDPIERVRANIASTLGLEKNVVLVKAVPDIDLFAVQIGTKGFLTDSTGTVAIPTKVVLPLSGQKDYFASPVKAGVVTDALPSVAKISTQPQGSSERKIDPDDQQGLDPNILFKNLKGMTIDLPAKGVKKGEIMVFFDTKCPHCKEQFNDIVGYADKGYEIKFLNTPLKPGSDKIFTTAFCSGAPFEALNQYMQYGSFSKSHLDFDATNVGCMRKSGEIVLDVIKLMPKMPGTPYFVVKDVGFGTRGFVNSYLSGS